MEWEQIRAHYERTFQASGRTQAEVAAAGGLQQNAISKLIANRRDGPYVETLLRAIRGLGLLPSQFFGQIEDEAQPTPGGAGLAVSAGHRADDEHLARFRRFGLALGAFEQSLRGDPPLRRTRPRKRRARRPS